MPYKSNLLRRIHYKNNRTRILGVARIYCRKNKKRIRESLYEWRRRNPEKIKKIQSKCWRKHKEKRIQQCKDYYHKHKKESLEYHRAYNIKYKKKVYGWRKKYWAKNKKKLIAYRKVFYSNPENIKKKRECSRMFYQSHKEMFFKAAKRRRVVLSGARGSHTSEQWEKLKLKFCHCCAICGKQEPFMDQDYLNLTEDHIKPISKGGSDYIRNIQPLCKRCNTTKHNKIIKRCKEALKT